MPQLPHLQAEGTGPPAPKPAPAPQLPHARHGTVKRGSGHGETSPEQAERWRRGERKREREVLGIERTATGWPAVPPEIREKEGERERPTPRKHLQLAQESRTSPSAPLSE